MLLHMSAQLTQSEGSPIGLGIFAVSDVLAWLGLEAVALAWLCMALALKNPGQGQGCRKPQAIAWVMTSDYLLLSSLYLHSVLGKIKIVNNRIASV
jgi:hypothetical protein